MKKLFIVGGTMGAGKTAACKILKNTRDNSVFLDGDWCWDMHPFIVNDETKAMVQSNITYMLNSFLRCSAYDNVVFCWVMHEQGIIDSLLRGLDLTDTEVHCVSLVCSPDALTARLSSDIEKGVRQPDIIARSVARLPLYDKLDTYKIDVSRLTPEQTAQAIYASPEYKCL